MEETAQKIRILIVDDIPETRESLRKLLYLEADIETVGAAGSGEEGVALAKDLIPDIVLMDINLPDMDGISAAEIIVSEVPGTQVVMMSVQGDADYLRRSMLAGAREFLIKPFTIDDLVTSMRRVHALRPRQLAASQTPANAGSQGYEGDSRHVGKVIAVFSPKGGRGCTTVATNLAVGLAKDEKYKVVLVDADLQFGDVAVFLNLSTDRTLADLIPQLEELEAEMVGEVIVPHSSGIKVLLAPPRPEMSELVTGESIRTLVLALREDFDYVIVDTPSSLDDVTLAVLDAADRVLVLTTPEVPAIKDARVFLELAEALGYPTEKIILGANKVLRKATITAREIEESTHQKLEFQVGRDDSVAAAAINQGEPALIGEPGSFLARGVKALAEMIVAMTQEPEKAESVAAGPASQKAGGARHKSGLLSALRR